LPQRGITVSCEAIRHWCLCRRRGFRSFVDWKGNPLGALTGLEQSTNQLDRGGKL